MRYLLHSLIPSLVLSITALAPAFGASGSSPVPDVTYRVIIPDGGGDSAVVRVKAVIPKGWHIQSNAPLDEFLIPTELNVTGEGLRLGKVSFPAPQLQEFPALGGQVALFSDTVDIFVTAYATKASKANKGKQDAKALAAALAKASVALRYQACNDSQCLPPKTVTARQTPAR